jgi:hypothetical protein
MVRGLRNGGPWRSTKIDLPECHEAMRNVENVCLGVAPCSTNDLHNDLHNPSHLSKLKQEALIPG